MEQLKIIILLIIFFINTIIFIISFLRSGSCIDGPDACDILRLSRKESVFRFSFAIFQFIEVIILFKFGLNILDCIVFTNVIILIIFQIYFSSIFAWFDKNIIGNINDKKFKKMELLRNKDKITFEFYSSCDNKDFEQKDWIHYNARFGNILLSEGYVAGLPNKNFQEEDKNYIKIKNAIEVELHIYSLSPRYIIKTIDHHLNIKVNEEHLIENANYTDEKFIEMIKEDIINKFGKKIFIID